ncbi:cyclin-A2 [Harmonia axyridis]|uniref:cyclin-A2 n=1 Tax=Harmonia axyridis TaxID=115357 RepID=UPI001E278DB5|nr:cyclin-A2 [Harmonia axyridis]
MATFKISQDKENRIQFSHKQDTMATQKQRSVLGLLDGNKVGEKVDKGAQKPVFGVRRDNVLSNTYAVPQQPQQNRRNFFLPVAQFQAFKVYEDSPDQESTDQKPLDEKMNEVVVIEEVPLKVEEVKEEKKAYSLSDLRLPQRSPKLDETYSDVSFNVTDKPDEAEVVEYQTDIYQYMRFIERKNRPKPGYMKKQPDISHNMRTILVDWLVEVAEEYRLHTETLYLAIYFIDRFLSYMSVVRSKLQLVGTAAMYIAAKYEEVYPPDITEFVYITDDTYTRRQLIRMEHLILKVLQFDLTTPSPCSFIKMMSILVKGDESKVIDLAMYICELGLLEAEPFLEFLPSVLGASSIALAQYTLGKDVWSEEFVDGTGFKLEQLTKCITFLDDIHRKAPNMTQKAIQEKYKSPKYHGVSKILPREFSMVEVPSIETDQK